MKYAYVYVLDTLADWEIGHVTSELHSGRFFKHPGERVPVKYVGATLAPITTMGGIKITPDATLDAVTAETTAVLILPGGDTWADPRQAPVIDKVRVLLEQDVTIAAICGATEALAKAGLLDGRPHTSNGLDYLKHVAPEYRGESWYRTEKAIADGNLITASSAGGLEFARLILARLGVFAEATLVPWYQYFSSGDPQFIYTMMDTLPRKE